METDNTNQVNVIKKQSVQTIAPVISPSKRWKTAFTRFAILPIIDISNIIVFIYLSPPLVP